MAAAAVAALLDDAVAKDKVYESERLADELEALARAGDAEAVAAVAERADPLAKVRRDVKLLSELLTEIKGNDGWKLATQKKGFTVHFKQPQDSPFIMTKASKEVTPKPGRTLTDTFVSLCALFAETDLMPKWFPRGLMESHETLLRESSFSRFTRIHIAFPALVPVSSREAIIHGKGYDITERSAMAISFKSLASDFTHPNFTVPEPDKKYVRIDIQGAYYLEVTPHDTVIFSQIMMMDLKLKFVPSFVLNALSKGHLPMEFTGNLLKRVEKFEGSEWDERCIAQPELYGDIRNRLDTHLAELKAGKGHGTPSRAAAASPAEAAASEDEEEEEQAAAPAQATPAAEADDGALLAGLRSVLSLFLEESRVNDIVANLRDWLNGTTRDGAAASPETRRSLRESLRRSIRNSFRSHPTPPPGVVVSADVVERLRSDSAGTTRSSRRRSLRRSLTRGISRVKTSARNSTRRLRRSKSTGNILVTRQHPSS